MPTRLPTLALFLMCVLISGCGGGSGVTTHGEVTLDGKPLEGGEISFSPADGKGPTMGTTITNGRYEVKAPPEAAGKKVVKITYHAPTGKKIPAGPPLPEGTMVDEIKQIVPTQYNTKSTLTAEVAVGKDNKLDFPLQSK